MNLTCKKRLGTIRLETMKVVVQEEITLAIFSVALKLIRQVAQTTELPIIGMGEWIRSKLFWKCIWLMLLPLELERRILQIFMSAWNLPKVMDKYGISSLEDLRREVKASLR
ncbi:Dihydroorotate dehydrogenase, catalytic subunit [Streptococcus oralis]|uniref:Dihydroorotate dehydrogenase, catalytic subunit n=1 Tax=Streptococcus oralis TaxID=1303 RepID=A0A139PDN8_STROR|nr:Dihydroorotate dehydrogenase, catalytic subunit [Streptococcus oralis]